jgi:hypothetical protein
MSQHRLVLKTTYTLGWLAFIASLIYKVLFWGSMGGRVYDAIHLAPKNFLQFGVVLFVVCIATAQYAHCCNDAPASASAKGHI